MSQTVIDVDEVFKTIPSILPGHVIDGTDDRKVRILQPNPDHVPGPGGQGKYRPLLRPGSTDGALDVTVVGRILATSRDVQEAAQRVIVHATRGEEQVVEQVPAHLMVLIEREVANRISMLVQQSSQPTTLDAPTDNRVLLGPVVQDRQRPPKGHYTEANMLRFVAEHPDVGEPIRTKTGKLDQRWGNKVRQRMTAEWEAKNRTP